MSKAKPFNKNIMASDIAISCCFAFITGAIAAMALPPQMAVPKDNNTLVFLFTLKSCPNISPSPIMAVILTMVRTIELRPTSSTSLKSTLNPSPITANFNNHLLA